MRFISFINPWDDNISNEEKNISNIVRKKYNSNKNDGDNMPPDENDIFDIFNIFRMKYIIVAVFAILVIIGLSGFYTVKPDQLGLILRFGKLYNTTKPGIHWRLPYIDQIVLVSVGRIRQTNIGMGNDTKDNSTILTGDQNIIGISCSVFWKVKNPSEFAFNVVNPSNVVSTSAQSAIRHVISSFKIQDVLTDGRDEIQIKIKELLQSILDSYHSGVLIQNVQLQNAQPPEQVVDAFNDVQRALQDRDRIRNEAEAYRNDIIPKARGDAVSIIESANAYRAREIKAAEGTAARFTAVYRQYRANRTLVRTRIYNDVVGKILGEIDKVIVSQDSGVMKYMPIQDLLNNKRKPNIDKK